MPVYNTTEYLQEALTSIFAQSFEDFELIAVDDGSTDGSLKILEDFAKQEPRMILIARENRGLIASRNELLAAARCEFIAWMDSDDISLPDRLALQVQVFEADPTIVCLGGSAQCIDPKGRYLNIEQYPLTHKEILEGQKKGGAMRFATTMMRRDVELHLKLAQYLH
jgi:glycosyltransferase involved in cell wall biosynthesis